MVPKPTETTTAADDVVPIRPPPPVHAEATFVVEQHNSPRPLLQQQQQQDGQQQQEEHDDDDGTTTATTTKKTTTKTKTKKKVFYYKNKPSEEEVRLPDGFQPCPKSVVMKQGTNTNGYLGNQRLKSIVASKGHLYEKASSRKERTHVVSLIIQEHFAQGGGPFVCWDRPRKAWFLACDMQRREKVGALLRDYHHTKYKSSTTAKVSKQRIDRREARNNSRNINIINNNNNEIRNTSSTNNGGVDCVTADVVSSSSSSSKVDGVDTADKNEDETDIVSQLLLLKEHHQHHRQGGGGEGGGGSGGNESRVLYSLPATTTMDPPPQPQHHNTTADVGVDASSTISTTVLQTSLAPPRTFDPTTSITVEAAKALTMAGIMMRNQEESKNGVAAHSSLTSNNNSNLVLPSHSSSSPTTRLSSSSSMLLPSSREATQSSLLTANTIQALTAASTATSSTEVSPKQQQQVDPPKSSSSSLLCTASNSPTTNSSSRNNNKASSSASSSLLPSPPLSSSSFSNVPSSSTGIAAVAYASNEARIAQMMIQQQQQQETTIASLSQMNHAQNLWKAIAGIKRKRKRHQWQEEARAAISQEDEEAIHKKEDLSSSSSSVCPPSVLEIARKRYQEEMRYILPSFLGGSPILCDDTSPSSEEDDENCNPLIKHLARCLQEYGGPDSTNLHPLLLRDEKKQTKRRKATSNASNAAALAVIGHQKQEEESFLSPATTNNPSLKKRLAECLERWGESSQSSLLGRQVGVVVSTSSPTTAVSKTMESRRSATSNTLLSSSSSTLQEVPTMLHEKAGGTSMPSSSTTLRPHSHAFSTTNSEKQVVPNFDTTGIVILPKPPSASTSSDGNPSNNNNFGSVDDRNKRRRLLERTRGLNSSPSTATGTRSNIISTQEEDDSRCYVAVSEEYIKEGRSHEERRLHVMKYDAGPDNREGKLMMDLAESAVPNPLLQMQSSSPNKSMAEEAVALLDFGRAIANTDYAKQQQRVHLERERQRRTTDEAKAATALVTIDGRDSNKKRRVINSQDAILSNTAGDSAEVHAVNYAYLQKQQHEERQEQRHKQLSGSITTTSSATALRKQESDPSSVPTTTAVSPNHGFTITTKPQQNQAKQLQRKDAAGTCNDDPFSIAKESSLHKNLLLAIEKDLADLQSSKNPKLSVLPRSHRVKTANATVPVSKKKTPTAISPSPPQLKKNWNETGDQKILIIGSTKKPMGPNDILCGRYKYAYNHIGNKRFRILIDSYLDRYLQAYSRKKERIELIRLIVRQLEEFGARFLRPMNHKQWNPNGENYVEELKDSEIREKVGHALRDLAVQKKNVLMSEWNNIKTGEEKTNKQANQSVAGAVDPCGIDISVNAKPSSLSTEEGKKEKEGMGTITEKGPSTLGSFLYERGMGPVENEVAKQIEEMRKASPKVGETPEEKEETGANHGSTELYENKQRRNSANTEKKTPNEGGDAANELLEVAKRMEGMQNIPPTEDTRQRGPSSIGGLAGSGSLHVLVAKRFHEKQRIQEGQRKLEAMIAQRIQEERQRSNSGSSAATIKKMEA